VQRETLEYARARDKSDRSLEVFKFYVNALYVAMTRAVRSLTLVEADTGHALLDLLSLQPGEAKLQQARASSKDEWAQEARKLELQGKAEQAQAIRETFLQHRPVPWTPWDRAHIEQLALKAFDAANPSTKPRQAIFDYALWHGQQHWIEQLAAVNFSAARNLVVDGEFLGAGWLNTRDIRLSLWDEGQLLVRRTVAALRQRHLQPYAAKNFKEVLRQGDVHGVDHRTPVGATALMLAARAGNAALVQALLDKGADPEVHDEFGHTAWLFAVNRALEEPEFARTGLPALFDLLSPPALDVQSDGRLVRIEHHQGEYWMLTLMLAGLKTQWSRCTQRPLEPWKYQEGFFAEQLQGVLEALPPHLWSDKRRKRSYVNHVLARAEVDSDYRPARRLWRRARHGRYLPNPALLLRRGDGWQPVYEALNLAWIERGCGGETLYWVRPAQLIRQLGVVPMTPVPETLSPPVP
jgi:hypothetical protein